MRDYVLRGVTMVEPVVGLERVGDLFVEGGVIVEGFRAGMREVEAAGKVIFPPLSDVHVHARDSILEAASCGGFGHVVTMANQVPPVDSVETVQAMRALHHEHVRVDPAACVTRGRLGEEVADLEALAAAGAVAFTDDGTMVADDAVMEEAMVRAAALGMPILDHAMVPSLMGSGVAYDGPTARRLGLPLVPPETEVEAVARDIALSRKTGCAVHVQHISCAGSVALIRQARADGVRVSGEATPHHLYFSAEDIPRDDGNWKMNPPLGSRTDREAVRAGVLDGTLSVLATDHAPHAAELKARGFRKAPFGIVGLETALGASYRVLVEECGMSLMEFIRRWTVGPGEVIPVCAPMARECFALGERPNFVLADFQKRCPVEPTRFVSGSVNTPFTGEMLPCVHGGVSRFARGIGG